MKSPLTIQPEISPLQKRKDGTKGLLENVAANLYRHCENKIYWSRKKINGKDQWHSLDTADRKVAEGRLAVWLKTCGRTEKHAIDPTLVPYFLNPLQKARHFQAI